MNKSGKRILKIALKRTAIPGLTALLLLFGSCVSQNMDELFRLPKPSEEYTKLQQKLSEDLNAGASYSAPATGANRQSIQLRDIDGDGVNEALAFFSVPGDKPLRVNIYKLGDNEEYYTAATIDGDGTGIESVSYLDMDGDGKTELVLGCRQGPDVMMLSLYTLNEFVPMRLALTDYTSYRVADLTDDGNENLVVVRHDKSTFSGAADFYALRPDSEVFTASAPLSEGAETIQKLTVGGLGDGRTALFVDGAYQGGLITDVFVLTSDGGGVEEFVSDSWLNITLDTTAGVSTGTVRNHTATCRDIDEDGVVEIPLPRDLPGNIGDTVFRALDWNTANAGGLLTFKFSTYHNNSDGWYMILPSEWRGKVSMRRVDSPGERTLVFSRWNGNFDNRDDFLAVYMLTGENRASRAAKENRFRLRTEDDVIYAAEFFDGNFKWQTPMTESDAIDSFRLIYSEWLIGT
jgi:hypothetical protein